MEKNDRGFIMYNNVVTILSAVLICLGTMYSVLCVIKMSLKDILKTRTVEYFDNAEMPLIEQVYYARSGIIIIAIGTILQIISIAIKGISFQFCILLSTIAILLCGGTITIGYFKMRNDQHKVSKIQDSKQLEINQNRICGKKLSIEKGMCVIGAVVILCPVILAIGVSCPEFQKINGGDNWIGFWGSYLGAILGGCITLYVLFSTIKNEKEKIELQQKIEKCDLLLENIAALNALHKKIMLAKREGENAFLNACIEFWHRHNFISLQLKCIRNDHRYKNVDLIENRLESFAKAMEKYIELVQDGLKEKKEKANSADNEDTKSKQASFEDKENDNFKLEECVKSLEGTLGALTNILERFVYDNTIL